MADDGIEVEDRFGIGGNNPPPELKIGEALREDVEQKHADQLVRADELLTMAEEFDADHETVEDEETSGILAAIITQMRGHWKIVDGTRQAVKAPYLEGERIIDGFFNKQILHPIEARATELNKKQTAYESAKAARIKREAQEAARKAQEEENERRREAERAERERKRAEAETRKAQNQAEAEAAAQRARAADDRAREAREAEDRARLERQQQTTVAESSAADRSRVRGDYAMSSLRTNWRFEIVDITKVPADYLVVNQSMVNAAIRGRNGKREIPGLRIYAVEEAVNR